MSKKLRLALVGLVALAALAAASAFAVEGEEISLEPAGAIATSGTIAFIVGTHTIECTTAMRGRLNEGPIEARGVMGSIESSEFRCTGGGNRVLRDARIARPRPLSIIRDRRVIQTGLLYTYEDAEFLMEIPIPGVGTMKCLYRGNYGVLVRVNGDRYGQEEGLRDRVPVFDDRLNPLRGRHDCTDATMAIRLTITPE
ncbi:MAG: hypothetical protein WBC33_12460, partial [Conexibacter sp.]